ncbi:hypothetical protein Goshw_020637, partial [Gossypium schwendimanii]|nr:hypothetical protein [Gossypium schwendimanii]
MAVFLFWYQLYVLRKDRLYKKLAELAAAAGRKGDGRSAYKVHTEEAENLVMEEKSQHRRMTPMKTVRTIANNNGKLFIEQAASRTVCLSNDRKRR